MVFNLCSKFPYYMKISRFESEYEYFLFALE